MRGTKPTKRQKIFLKEHRLNSDNWLICKDTPTEMVIKHRMSEKERILKKGWPTKGGRGNAE